MNFSPYAIAFGHGYSKTIPQRRFRRRVGLRGPVSGARSRRGARAQPRVARGLQWTEVDCENRLRLALYAPRPASVGGRLPANTAMDKSGRLRGDDPRFAHAFAPFEGQSARAYGSYIGLAHAEIHPGERIEGRLRRTQEQEGLEGARRGGHLGTPARLARESGQRGRPRAGGEALRGDPRSYRRVGGVGLRRSRVHGREGVRVRRRTRHPFGGGQARGGQARLRALAEEMGGGAGFRLGIALSEDGEGLRAAARDGGGAAFRRVCLPLPPAGDRHPPRRFITPSSHCSPLFLVGWCTN